MVRPWLSSRSDTLPIWRCRAADCGVERPHRIEMREADGGAGVDPENEVAKDPAEQEMLARGIGDELTEIFVRYVRGELDFAEATFAAYDVLEDLHVIASGDYELEEDGDLEDEYTEEGATEQQEDLAQEPARG